MKTLILIFFVNYGIAQTSNTYVSSYKIADVDQKSFIFKSPNDEVVLSLKSKAFTRTNGEVFKLLKSKNRVFLTIDTDTVAVKIKNCIYSLEHNDTVLYKIRGRSLKIENKDILEGYIKFKGNEVQVSIRQISSNIDKGVIYLFLYKILTEAKIINESNLFTTGILPGLL